MPLSRLLLAASVLAVMLLAAAPEAAAQTTPAPQPSSQQGPGQLTPGQQPSGLPSAALSLPSLNLSTGEEDYELPIQLLLLLTVLSLAPAIIILMTSFTRLVVILSLLRTALGTQQSPPTQVIIGLSLFLTFYIMYPVLSTVHDDALQPYLNGEITQQIATDRALVPMKDFMLTQTREKDLLLFMDLADIEVFDKDDQVPLRVLVPAFVISELRIAFQIGFMLFLPFVVVDLIVASVLMSMGMMMLPPIMISLPVKLLLFVLTDGWYLIVESVVRGYLGV